MIGFQNLSIKRKLILIILTVSTSAIILGLIIYSILDIYNFRKEIEGNAKMSATLVGNYCIAPLLFGYKDEAIEILNKLEALPDIYNACVYDIEGNIFVSYEKLNESSYKYPKAPFKENRIVGNFLHLFHTILYQNETYGVIYMRISVEVIREKIVTNSIIMLILIGVLILPIYFLASRLQKIISEPVLALANITQRISQKDDFSVQIQTDRKDELGVLYNQFDNMLKQIRIRQEARDKAQHELKTLNEQLEQKVTERTAELENTNVQLHTAKEKAEAASKAKSIFLSNMSHELRTPMNAILGFSQLLIRDKNTTPSQLDTIKTINRSGEHLLALINDVLEMSKIEAGHVSLRKTSFDLHALIEDIEVMFRVRTDVKGLDLNVEVSDDFPKYVVSDDGKIRQILINLIGNAVKFTDKGGINIRADLVEKSDQNLKLYIEVEDSGIGIKNEDLVKIFNYFEQVTSRTKLHEGSGLGLAISKQFTTLLGGDITVKSKYGKGSNFRFEFVVQKGKKEDVFIEYNSKRVVSLTEEYKNFKVLVADDRETNRRVLTNLLKLVGFEVREAVNGKEALDIYQNWKPPLVLMDMVMPVMDGFEATRQIKELKEGRDTAIIAITASVLEDQVDMVLKTGTSDFIRKPFKEAELFEKIKLHCKLDYIYDEKSEPETPKEVRGVESLENLKTSVDKLPKQLLKNIQDALLNGYQKKLLKLIDETKEHDNKLAVFMLRLAKGYKYDEIMNLLK